MNICILIGSSERDSKIEILLRSFIEELKAWKINIEYINLCDKYIGICEKSSTCQSIDGNKKCLIKDDMEDIYIEVLKADCIVFAAPIYSGSCTTPMKAVIDRLFCMDKFTENKKDLYRLWMLKYCAAISTCSNEDEYGAGLFEEAVKRLAENYHINYVGMLSVRDVDGTSAFETDEIINSARKFAVNIIMRFRSSMFGHVYIF